MKKYMGGEKGPQGVYINLSTGEFVQLNKSVRVLPGGSEVRYLNVPPVAAMILGPFAGLAFIIFLPFAGMVGIVSFLVYKLWRGVLVLEGKTLRLVNVGWQPGRADFTRRSGPQTGKAAGKDEAELKELADEIARLKKDDER